MTGKWLDNPSHLNFLSNKRQNKMKILKKSKKIKNNIQKIHVEKMFSHSL